MLAGPSFRAQHCVHYGIVLRVRMSLRKRAQNDQSVDAGVEVIVDLCKSCGLCVADCPTEALTETSVSTKSLLGISADEKQLTIACAPSGAKGDAIVSSLGAMNPVVISKYFQARMTVQLTEPGTVSNAYTPQRDLICCGCISLQGPRCAASRRRTMGNAQPDRCRIQSPWGRMTAI